MKFIAPMECRAVTEVPKGEGWAYEIKWDGYRALGTTEWLLSRTGKPLLFPLMREHLREVLPSRSMVDGEICALDAAGRPSFNLLQNYHCGVAIRYFVFDLLVLSGDSLLKQPWSERRALLRSVLPADELICLSEAFDADVSTILQVVREHGLEGVVAKRRTSCYEPGRRSGAWSKVRVYQGGRQEFVVGGFTRSHLGVDSLLVGYYEGRRLLYAARTRNGLVPATRRYLYALLSPLQTHVCPFDNLPERGEGRWGEGMTAERMKGCTWVKPETVVMIDFVEWTPANHLRHARYVALRGDKAARDVVRETVR